MYIIACNKCSLVLYAGEKPIDVLRVLVKYGDKCPRCLHKFSLKPKQIRAHARSVRNY